jgi:CheY-like chemotaxis protein
MKTRFISNVSHELRTPISSILNLSRLLLDHIDGPLNGEQEKQVLFIRKSGEALQELIDDLLDLAKIESGRVEVQPTRFSVADLFGALRGMLRPLRVHEGVSLLFEEAEGLPELHTDERKLSQILRNLISNALKFTQQGEVRVSAAPGPRGTVVFSVRDTGVGIAPEDQERIFEEFVQVEGPHQQGVKGTGLGLPLSRRLAELLGGSLDVHSQPGEGSTFQAVVASDYTQRQGAKGEEEAGSQSLEQSPSNARTVLIIDDDEVARYLVQRLLAEASLQFREAASGGEGLRLAGEMRPAAILLDMSLPDMDGSEVLEALRRQSSTRNTPVIIHSSRSMTEQERGRLIPHVVGILPKSGLTREGALELIHQALAGSGPRSGGSSTGT